MLGNRSSDADAAHEDYRAAVIAGVLGPKPTSPSSPDSRLRPAARRRSLEHALVSAQTRTGVAVGEMRIP